MLAGDAIHLWRLPYRRARGRTPLLELLGRYLDRPAERVGLVEDAHGRPRLEDRALDFNWSHSGDSAWFAVSRRGVLGVDVEADRPRPNALALARRYFAAEEAAWLAQLPAPARERAFLRLWVAKEAVVKALGRGLGFGLHRVVLAATDEGLVLQRVGEEAGAAWTLRQWDLGPAGVAALAWRGPARPLHCLTLADPA